MLKIAVKHLIAINAVTANEWYPDIQQEIKKLKSMDTAELSKRLKTLKNVLYLVTSFPRLAEPKAENIELKEHIKKYYPNGIKEHFERSN